MEYHDCHLVLEMRRSQSLRLVLPGVDMFKDLHLNNTVFHQLLQAKLLQ
jgi:hypothetical protein